MLKCGCADRPLPPRNVRVSNIKGESCYLHWDAPRDNGGSELTNYIVEKKEVLKEEPELEEGEEPPAEPQWTEVNNSIIERKYGVSSETILHSLDCSTSSIRMMALLAKQCVLWGRIWLDVLTVWVLCLVPVALVHGCA